MNPILSSIDQKETDCVHLQHKEARWSIEQIQALFDLPFNDLIYQAQSAHRQYHDANTLQLSTLISVKTGGVLRIADIVLKQHAIIPMLKIKTCFQPRKWFQRQKLPKQKVLRVFVWELLGEDLSNAI